MDDKGKHRVIKIPTDNEIDSFVGGVRAKNTDRSTEVAMSLLTQYKNEIFTETTEFKDIEEDDQV